MSQYRWVALFASFYSFATFAFALQVIPPMMGQMIHEFGISHAQGGLLMSLVMVPGIFLAIPAGILVDRYGVRPTGIISTILIAMGCLVTAIAGLFETALVGRLILGVGGAFMATAMPAIIPQWFPPKDLGKAMGIYGTNMPLASTIAFLSASRLMPTHGWRYLFYISTAMALMNIVTFALLVKEGYLKHEHKKESNVRQAMKSVEIWKVGIIWLLFNSATLSFTTWAPKVFEGFKGMDPLYATLLASVPMLAAMPCVPIFGWISDKIRKHKPLMILGSALTAVSLAAIAYTSNEALALSIIALGIAAALVPPMVMALPPEVLGPALAGTGFGIVAMCFNMGIAVAAPFIGFLIDITGAPTISFLIMALVSAMGTIVAYTVKTE